MYNFKRYAHIQKRCGCSVTMIEFWQRMVYFYETENKR